MSLRGTKRLLNVVFVAVFLLAASTYSFHVAQFRHSTSDSYLQSVHLAQSTRREQLYMVSNNNGWSQLRRLTSHALLAVQLVVVNGRMVGAADIDLRSELASFQEATESEKARTAKEPKAIMQNLQRKLGGSQKINTPTRPANAGDLEKQIQLAAEKVITLKAYLDEAERDLFERNWDNLQVYLYTFAEQEDSFALLIDNLFPNESELDNSERAAMSFEAQSMFLALDDLREAARDHSEKLAQRAYSNLLLAYDRFLKAGDLYPTYDVITSTEIFYSDTPKSELKFNADRKVQVLDEVVLTSGPDMGKTGTVINIDNDNAVVKLDKDGKAYQEVKYVKTGMLAVAETDSGQDAAADANKRSTAVKKKLKKTS